MKKSIRYILIFLTATCLLNLVWTSSVQRFICPEKSETQLFLLLPKNFIYKFDFCK